MILKKLTLDRLQSNQLFDLANFIVTENFNHHTNDEMPEDAANDIQSIYEEEKNYFSNSKIFVAKDNSESIVGAIRLLKWNYTDVLPLEKIFGINPFLAITEPNVNDIYHIGRFAVKKDACDLNLFKRLLVCVSEVICKNNKNIAFAEIDSKLLRILRLLGLKAMVIGESVDYLGSETIPIAMTSEGIMSFYNKNKHLVEEEVMNSGEVETLETPAFNIPNPAIFATNSNNYPLV